MPTTTSPRAPFAAKLRAELDRKSWGIRRLAREIDPANPEPARRQIHRHLSGAHAPSRVTRHRYCDALGIDRAALEDDDEEADSLSLDALLTRRIQALVREATASL